MSGINWPAIQAAIQHWVVRGSGLAADRVLWTYEKSGRPPAPHIMLSASAIRMIGHDFTTLDDNPLVFVPLTVSAVDTATDRLAIAAHGLVTGDGPVRLASTGALPAPLAAGVDYWVVAPDAGHVQLASTYVHTGGNNVARGLGSTPNPITVINLTTAGSGTISLSATDETVRAGQELLTRAQGSRQATISMQCLAPEGGGIQAVQILADVLASLQLNVTTLDNAGVGVSDFGEAFAQGGVRLVEGRRGSILEPRAVCDLTVYLASEILGTETTVESLDGQIALQSDGGGALPAIPVKVTRS